MAGILCVDVGSGTQDVLCWQPGLSIENCPKFVLPSPARRVGARIRELTARGAGVHLCGANMGGGFVRAVRAHLQAGLGVSATPRAALALTDDPSTLEARMGVRVLERCPEGHVPVHQADFDPGFWQGLLAQAGVEAPDMVLACAQDHGCHPGQSSRLGRFRLWERFLAQGPGRLADLLYVEVPAELTRLAELQEAIGGGPVMDTGPAAALGVLHDPELEALVDGEGALVVNMGNSHVLGLLVRFGRLHGVYEHHTGMLEAPELARQLERFRTGAVDCAEVFGAGGHGCAFHGGGEAFRETLVIGPRRAELAGHLAARFPAPLGDMMLTGCFGLLKAWQERGRPTG
ncbi:hypothetical protein NNJEOMEG_01115 [Fundidesulfovibrio magnetotacticus]|uniref:Pyruvate formate lyase-activating protein n=1 Tax=Fundidesulfovibrio magnetotacticus TaxID=2730080 RepID=A0A6V8LNM3_9BACT|nr:DUF1786 domain-containing protein [Fundidesulfovibrio magnetotacticus]GFK93284.1 hypothetical protein NNJEOMEG_01115 [Fundidesulfovibrio magnetotacticus]